MAQVPSVSVKYAANGSSTKSNGLGMRAMQERAYEKRSGRLSKSLTLHLWFQPAHSTEDGQPFHASGRLAEMLTGSGVFSRVKCFGH